MKRILASSTALCLALIVTTSANALTYVGTRTAGTATINLSITTDGAIGSLQNNNITDWNVSIVDGTHHTTLEGPSGLNNSIQFLSVGGLTATYSDLFFNFDAPELLTLAFLATKPGDNSRYCLTSINAQCNGFSPQPLNSGRELVRVFNFGRIKEIRSGIVSIATIPISPPGGVPEPASWALMIAGFGLVGSAMRRRASVQVTYV